MTPRKRKPTGKALGEDLAESSPAPKRAKVSAKTPKEPAVKVLNANSAENTPSAKSATPSARPSRKCRTNISDEDSAEASPKPQRPTAPSESTETRAIAPRAAKVDRNDPFWLTTNEKSPLTRENLYAELSNPRTYEHLTKEDWEELREELPPNVPLSADGYSIPMNFFKYDADFRRGIREFQEDLSTGRLDPGWQEAAGEAMEERVRGDFDAYKENQFEEFWGQKQKLDWRAVAGESAKLKLDVMIRNGVFQEGDYFSFSRVAGRGKARTLVEKECKIVTVGSNTLIFAIPPGQLKYARPMAKTEHAIKDSPSQERALQPDNVTQSAAPNDLNGEASNVANGERSAITNDIEPPAESEQDDAEATKDNATGKDTKATGGETNGEEIGIIAVKSVEQHENADPGGSTMVIDLEEDTSEIVLETEIERNTAEPGSVEHNPPSTSTACAPSSEDVVIHEISTLAQLEIKILEIDGRLHLTGVRPSINAWKAFRGKRNNQDLGTLFEMREEFYVWKQPHIPKPPRSSGHGLRYQ